MIEHHQDHRYSRYVIVKVFEFFLLDYSSYRENYVDYKHNGKYSKEGIASIFIYCIRIIHFYILHSRTNQMLELMR